MAAFDGSLDDVLSFVSGVPGLNDGPGKLITDHFDRNREHLAWAALLATSVENIDMAMQQLGLAAFRANRPIFPARLPIPVIQNPGLRVMIAELETPSLE